jgi:hypothetical protein
MPRKFQNVFVMHEGKIWPAQIVQINCPQDVSKDDLVKLKTKRASLIARTEHDDSKDLAEEITRTDAKIERSIAGPRLGGKDELVDVVLMIASVPEDNGDPNYEKLKEKFTEYIVHGGLSNVRRAKTPGDRVDGTWWDRAEDKEVK